jgi:hypothetical protein
MFPIIEGLIILFIILLIGFMGHLSVRMDRRRRGVPYRGFKKDALQSLWDGAGEHFLPIMYLPKESDAFLERVRKKRNWTVIAFWVVWIVIVIGFMKK